MKGTMTYLILIITIAALFAGSAEAAVFTSVKSWLSAEVVSLALSALLTILGGVMGLLFKKIARTFKEAGEFLTVLGEAVEDTRLTREELADIINEGKDIFAVWR